MLWILITLNTDELCYKLLTASKEGGYWVTNIILWVGIRLIFHFKTISVHSFNKRQSVIWLVFKVFKKLGWEIQIKDYNRYLMFGIACLNKIMKRILNSNKIEDGMMYLIKLLNNISKKIKHKI